MSPFPATGIPARNWLLLLTLQAVLTACSVPKDMPALDVPIGSSKGADVILITLDTTRADQLGCYGMAPSFTPNLDRLCAGAVRFSNAVTPAPVTLPAHTSLLTGLLPPNHGVRYNGEFHVDAALPTLAADLAVAGYQTAAFVSSFVLDHRFGLSKGFDVYDDQVAGESSRRGVVSRNERDAAATTTAALAFLAQRERQRPVFLWVHYYDPHAPYVPLQAPTTADSAAAYAGEIADVDAQIGRLLDAPMLDNRNAVVIVTADHGEALGEHGERTHGLFVYDSTTHIPLIVQLPQQRLAGRTVPSLAALTDLRPSLLDLLGIHRSDRVDGISWLTSQRGHGDAVYQEAAMPYFDFGFAPVYGLRSEFARYIEGAEPEYYDLATDPKERINRYSEMTGKNGNPADTLRQGLDARMLTMTDIATAARSSPTNDAATMAKLRSLGYLGEGAPAATDHLPDTRAHLDVINLHQDAVRFVDAKQWNNALALLDRADAISPGNPSVLRLKAKAELLSGRIDAAESTLRRLLEKRRSADTLVLLAQISILRKDIGTATRLLDEAAGMEPDHGGIFIARGDIAAAAGQHGAALALYGEALSKDSSRTGAIAKGRIKGLGGTPTEAADEKAEPIRQTPIDR